MRVITITDPQKSSDFIIRDVLFAAHIDDHDVEDVQPIELGGALNKAPADLIVVEAHTTRDFAEKMVEQAKKFAPDTPIFVLYHQEAAPLSGAEREKLAGQFAFTQNVAGFFDTNAPVNDFARQLLQAAGIKPQFELNVPNKANIQVGNIRFNVLEQKAYTLHTTQANGELDDVGPLRSIAHVSQQVLFSLRAKSSKFSNQFDASTHENVLFGFSAEEARFIEVLSLRQGEPIKRNDIADMMYRGIVRPDVSKVDTLEASLLDKIGQFVDNPEAYIQYIPDEGYLLNDDALSIQAPDIAADIDADLAPAEDPYDAQDPLIDFGDTSPDRKPAAAADYTTYDIINERYVIGNFVIDNGKGIMYPAGQRKSIVPLEDAESSLLQCLHREPNIVLSLADLRDDIFPGDNKPDTKYVRTLIAGLNDKLKGMGAEADVIQSIRGRGFTVIAPTLDRHAHPVQEKV